MVDESDGACGGYWKNRNTGICLRNPKRREWKDVDINRTIISKQILK
jgi:hypothetical protein